MGLVKFLLFFVTFWSSVCFAGIDDNESAIDDYLPAIKDKYAETLNVGCSEVYISGKCEYEMEGLKRIYESIDLDDNHEINVADLLINIANKTGYNDLVAKTIKNVNKTPKNLSDIYDCYRDDRIAKMNLRSADASIVTNGCVILSPFRGSGYNRRITVAKYKSDIKEEYQELKKSSEVANQKKIKYESDKKQREENYRKHQKDIEVAKNKEKIERESDMKKRKEAAYRKYKKLKPEWNEFVSGESNNFRKKLNKGSYVHFITQETGLTKGIVVSKSGDLITINRNGYIIRKNISEVWPEIPSNLIIFLLYDYSVNTLGVTHDTAIEAAFM